MVYSARSSNLGKVVAVKASPRERSGRVSLRCSSLLLTGNVVIAVDDTVQFELLAPEAKPHLSIRDESAQIQLHPTMQTEVAQDIEETVRFVPSMGPELR
jgi:hypothetical protein